MNTNHRATEGLLLLALVIVISVVGTSVIAPTIVSHIHTATHALSAR
jgi:hypothetical protein